MNWARVTLQLQYFSEGQRAVQCLYFDFFTLKYLYLTTCSFVYRPDTATYIQKMERERDAREKGKSSNNKSMLGKYVSKNIFKINKYI